MIMVVCVSIGKKHMNFLRMTSLKNDVIYRHTAAPPKKKVEVLPLALD